MNILSWDPFTSNWLINEKLNGGLNGFEHDRLQRLIQEVNILLISDLHYDIKKDDPKGSDCLSIRVNNALVRSLEAEKKDWYPDIVIVAGDLVNLGKAANYDLYFDLIGKITAKFPNLKNAIFCTPGNHDIDRSNIVSANPYLYTLKKRNPGEANKISYTKSDIVDTIYTVSQFNLDDADKIGMRKFLSQFEKQYFHTYLEQQKTGVSRGIYKKITKEHPCAELETVYIKDILGIRLVSFNSSFFCNSATVTTATIFSLFRT